MKLYIADATGGNFTELEYTLMDEITDKPHVRNVRVVYTDGRIEHFEIAEAEAIKHLSSSPQHT